MDSDKEQALIALLDSRPGIPLKEINVALKERFDSGVSGAMLSRLKRKLEKERGTTPEDQAPAESAAPVKTQSPEAGASLPESSCLDAPGPVQKAEAPAPALAPAPAPARKTEASAPPEEAKDTRPRHPVRLQVKIPEAETVHLAGSFNKWKPRELAMNSIGRGSWVFEGELPEGEHSFKFVVDGHKWHLDFERERCLDSTGVSHPLKVP